MGILSKELLYTVVIMLGSFTFGTVTGYTSPASQDIRELHHLSESSIEWSLYTAIAHLFGVAGPFLCNYILALLHKSRKKTVFVIAVATTIVWLLQMVVKFSIYAGLVARAILGVCVGAYSSITPMYIVEMAPDDARGFFGVLHEAGIIFGLVIINVFGPSCGYLGLCGVGGALNAIQAILIWFIPESPALAVIIAQDAVALKNNEHETQKETVFSKKHWKELMTGVFTMVMQQFTGISAIIANLSPILQESGLAIDGSYQAAIAVLAQFLSVFLGGFVMDKLGRRIVWTMSNSGVIFFLILYALNAKYNWSSIMPMIVIFLYQLSYGMGAGPIPWFICPEYFPNAVRAQGMAFVSSTGWIIGFVMIFVWPQILVGLGKFGAYIFFACMTVISVVFGLFFVHEPPPRETIPIESDQIEPEKVKVEDSSSLEAAESIASPENAEVAGVAEL